MKNYNKYKRLYDWKRPNERKWTDKEITKAPIWCSVDLRDGNQALAIPMSLKDKIELFNYLVSIGVKEIEIGFPAANEIEYQFARCLIENDMIPKDVTIQVITQAKKEMIEKTFEALKGARKAIVNYYNSISKKQREVVFRKDKEAIKQIAVIGAKTMVECSNKYSNTEWQFEYSAESFTNTEMDYAIDVINTVLKEWKDKTKLKPIINLPATVECSTPNIFADQIEYICENIKNREDVIISIHTHNDRGTANASAELGLLAGAERVECTLFGNGERTGMSDLVTLALNLYVTGVDPQLDFSQIKKAKFVYESSTNMKVPPRQPYAGELVFTAFSGSHQDAISKGLKYIKDNPNDYWEVPYLPINPEDINRQYEPIIRINSQSGKGGVAFILETEFGYEIPKIMQNEIGNYFKVITEKNEKELSNDEIYSKFSKEYKNRCDTIKIKKYKSKNAGNLTIIDLEYTINGEVKNRTKSGNGPIAAFIELLKDEGYECQVINYIQKSLNENNEKSEVVTYVKIKSKDKYIWGIGQDSDATKAGFKSVTSALNRMIKEEQNI
ncbi:MAG: 2-isopropylmalate synthase [Clostridia bacterium]|nr:2-isopropylmalate synthase [Clostridia bacterium]